MGARSLSFSKMHGLGNDFLVADNRAHGLRLAPAQVRAWGNRHTGVGFDQMLVAEEPREARADFAVRIYNCDGSEAGQCGNGMRCIALFARRRGLITGNDTLMEVPGGLVRARIRDDEVTVSMGVPNFEPARVPFLADSDRLTHTLDLGNGERVSVGVVSMGNPHAVQWVEEVERVPVPDMGARIQQSGSFPQGVNVGFAQCLDTARIRLRVYERGAGETRACGSGACAAVAVGIRQGMLESEVCVDLPGGRLRVAWPGKTKPVWLTGEATHVFDGELQL
jgi:diaminopimelate epimerase